MRSPAWCPPGYVALSAFSQHVETQLSKGVTFGNFIFREPLKEWFGDLLHGLESALSWGPLDAIGVDASMGSLTLIPREAWRSEPPRRMEAYYQQPTSQFGAALMGQPILRSAYLGPLVYPAIAASALAEWLGSPDIPSPPDIVPSQPEKKSAPATEQEGSTVLREWVHGYAYAYKELKGTVVKRDEIERAAEAAKKGSKRQAIVAFQDLPPELRNPPRE